MGVSAGAPVTVNAAAKLVDGVSADGRRGVSVLIENVGAVDVRIGGDNTVSSTVGKKLAAGQAISFDLDADEQVWAASTAGAATLEVMVTGA